jgi:hypothetical protein
MIGRCWRPITTCETPHEASFNAATAANLVSYERKSVPGQSLYRLDAARSLPEARQCVRELSARADSELGVNLAEVPFDGPPTQEEPCGYLGI